jgi:hypothetical protein
MVDLADIIFKPGVLESHQSVYVFDSHRPYHLKNIFARGGTHTNLYFITDESVQNEQYKPFVELFAKQSDESLKRTWEIASKLDNYHGQVDAIVGTEEQNNDDNMDEDPDNEDAAYLEYDDGSDMDDFIVDDEDDNREFDDDEYVEGGRRDDSDDADDNFTLGARQSDFRNKDEFSIYKTAALYYHKTRFGSPSSHVLYQCITNTRTSLLATPKLHNNILWAAIVGITEQFELERIDVDTYNKLINDYWSYVLNTNPVSRPQMQTDDGHMIPVSDDERIAFIKDECRLMLYRHWNLYESMQNSKYVVSQLGTYKQHGMDKLHVLLATIGVDLKECKQNFINMINDNKRHFFARLKQECRSFHLGNIFYNSFVRHYGSTFQVSASDMVHALIAMMESPLTAGSQGSDRTKQTSHSNKMSSALWENNFSMAYEALNGNTTLIKRGIARAIHMQRAMTRQIVAKMDTPIEQSRTSMFRHIQLKSMDMSSFGTDQSEFEYADFGYKDKTEANIDCNLFLSPLSVTRLGLFFMEILESLDNRKLPVVISVPIPSSSINRHTDRTELLVGISASSSGHKFGSSFKRTYERLKLTTVRQVGFGSSAIEIPADVKMDFISVLFLTMGGQGHKK